MYIWGKFALTLTTDHFHQVTMWIFPQKPLHDILYNISWENGVKNIQLWVQQADVFIARVHRVIEAVWDF